MQTRSQTRNNKRKLEDVTEELAAKFHRSDDEIEKELREMLPDLPGMELVYAKTFDGRHNFWFLIDKKLGLKPMAIFSGCYDLPVEFKCSRCGGKSIYKPDGKWNVDITCKKTFDGPVEVTCTSCCNITGPDAPARVSDRKFQWVRLPNTVDPEDLETDYEWVEVESKVLVEDGRRGEFYSPARKPFQTFCFYCSSSIKVPPDITETIGIGYASSEDRQDKIAQATCKRCMSIKPFRTNTARCVIL